MLLSRSVGKFLDSLWICTMVGFKVFFSLATVLDTMEVWGIVHMCIYIYSNKNIYIYIMYIYIY